MIWSKNTDEQGAEAEKAVDSRVVYVNRRISGAKAGNVLTVEWSDHWQGHADAGNVSVVRVEDEPEYTENVYLDESGATDLTPLHDDGSYDDFGPED